MLDWVGWIMYIIGGMLGVTLLVLLLLQVYVTCKDIVGSPIFELQLEVDLLKRELKNLREWVKVLEEDQEQDVIMLHEYLNVRYEYKSADGSLLSRVRKLVKNKKAKTK